MESNSSGIVGMQASVLRSLLTCAIPLHISLTQHTILFRSTDTEHNQQSVGIYNTWVYLQPRGNPNRTLEFMHIKTATNYIPLHMTDYPPQ